MVKMHSSAEPVLIVGGGPTGLAASLFLTWQDVPSIVVERRTRPSSHPRARAINPRTMELFRSIGLEDEIRASPSPIAGNDLLVHATSLAGAERMRMPTASPEEIGAVSHCEWMLIDQTQLEPILLRAASRSGVDVRVGTELERIEQDATGVTATMRKAGTGERYQIRAGHVIGADGAASSVRKSLGIAWSGPGVVTNVISVFFRADLGPALRGRKIAACYVNNEQLRGTLIPIDNDRRWVFNMSILPERGQRPEDFTPLRRATAVRDAVGVPDLELELEDPASPPWDLSVGLAERFIKGRVLLAGDAAHAMPPTGAFGASTGIQDAHNLAWKLALTRRGLAGPGLLASYGAERRAVAAATLHQAMLRFQLRQGRKYEEVAPDMAKELAVVFGYRYPDGALIPDDGFQDTDMFHDPAKPTGRSGTRAPHLRLTTREEHSSVLDLFGRNFVLLATGNGVEWGSAAAAVAGRRGLPLDTCRIDLAGDVPGLGSTWAAAYGVLPDGAVLIRPDGFIAWRATSSAVSRETVLDRALTQILDNETPPHPQGDRMSTTQTTELTPAPLNRMLLGFCRSRLLMSAVEMNLFGVLATGGRTESQLRAELNLHPRFARDFLDALTSLGVLRKDGDRYVSSELAERFLDPGKPSNLSGFTELAAGMQWTAWGRLTRALRTGEIQVSTTADTGKELFRVSVGDDPERVRRFMAAMDSHSTRIGDELARCVDWSGYESFADIGGARGNLAARIVLGQPHLRGICIDRPASEPFFTEHIAVLGLSGKVTFQAGDFFTDPLPVADVLIYGHVLHDWDPETRKTLIRRAYQALRPGGTLIIYDRMIDEQLSDPDVLLFSLTFMLTSAGGSEYRVDECLTWLREAGFREVSATPILENHTVALARR